jgi:cysteine-rich repeat protein
MRTLPAAILGATLTSCGGGAPAPPVLAPPVEPAATCGDGVVQPPEECDDANVRSDDGCLATCFRPSSFVAGDPHLHSYGCNAQKTPEELADLVEDAGLRVAAALVWGLGYEVDSQYFTGRDYPDGRPGLVLHYDLEVSGFAAARGGHLVLLGLDSIDFSPRPFDEPRSGIPVMDWALAQGPGVVTGMAHAHLWPEGDAFPELPGGCCMPFELPVHAARGRLDFLAVERPGPFPLNAGAFRLWRALQNAGFRVAAAGSSDYSCLNHGFFDRTPRTDVVLDGNVTYARWLDGLRRGRASLAIGPDSHLGLRVNGVLMGGELEARSGDRLTVALESDLEEPAMVEVLVNGAVAGRVAMDAGRQAATLGLTAQAGAWIVARSPRAMTNPVYVLVDGRPIRASAEDACYLLRAVEHVRGLPLDRGESAAAAFAAYDEAAEILRQRFLEAGGGTCG